MVAVAGFAVSCLLVLGFYGYVLIQLYREHQRFKAQENRLRKHLLALESKAEIKVAAPKVIALPSSEKHMRSEALIQVGVAVGGLLGLFAEIGFLSRLITSIH